MKLTISDVEYEFEQSPSVQKLLDRIEATPMGIAVAVNDKVIRKSFWNEHELRDGDRVEIVRAIQGG